MFLPTSHTEVFRFLARIARIAEAQGLPQGIARDMAAIALNIPDQLVNGVRVFDLTHRDREQTGDGVIELAQPEQRYQVVENRVADLTPLEGEAQVDFTFFL